MKFSTFSIGGLAAGFALATFAAFPAYAEDDIVLGAHRHTKFETTQNFAIEFRFSPFRPAIDSAPGLIGKPYESVYGTDPRLLFAVEFDWQFLRLGSIGSLGVGGSIGYTSSNAPARIAATGANSAETTTLEIAPITATAVFRLNYLRRELSIPLEPYAKAGLGVGLWRASTESGTSTYIDANGTTFNGKGMSWGPQFAGGLGLSLNWLDPSAAKSLDTSIGINNTLVFAEYMHSGFTNFGSTRALRVGGSQWVFGLAFEF